MSNKITITLQAKTSDAKKNIAELEKDIKNLTTSIEQQSQEQIKRYNNVKSAISEQSKQNELYAQKRKKIVDDTINDNRRLEQSMKDMTNPLKQQLNELENLKSKIQEKQKRLFSQIEDGSISDKNIEKAKDIYKKREEYLNNHIDSIKKLRKELTEVTRSQNYQELSDEISTNKKLESEQLKSLKAEQQLYTQSSKVKKESLEDDIRLNAQGLADNKKRLEKLQSQINQEIAIYKERDIALRKSMQGMSFGTTPESAKQSYTSKQTTTPKQTIDDKVIQNLKEQYKNTYELTSAQLRYNDAKKRLDAMMSSNAISREQYNKALSQEGKLLKENKGSYESTTNAVVRHLRQIETLIVSYYMLKGAWDATIGVGINVNRTIESNTQGIAALITANTRMTTSTGQAVTNQQKFAMSQTIAAETMKKIKTAAIDTAGTFEDLIMIFQQATGQTLSMGDSMGGSIKEIIDNTIQLSKRMANISGAIGQPLDRTREEIRSLLSGNASTDSLISTMIFGSPSQANQAMAKAKASGKDGVKKLLDEMLAPFDVLEGLMTYDIQFNRMKDAYQSLAATTTKPIFDGLTQSFANIANYLTAEKIEAIGKSFENVGNAVSTVVTPLVQIATYLAIIKGGMIVWNNFLPTIEKLTVGAVDLVRGTGKVTSSMTFASQATGRFATETSNAVKGTGLFATAMATSATNANRFTTAVDMSKVGLANVGGAFTGLMGIMKNNLPMMAMIGAYELYNYTIGKTLEREENLRNAMSLKLEDIKKLSLAQAQTGLADINVGLSELIKERDAIGKQILSGTYGEKNAVGEWVIWNKLSKEEKNRLEAQQQTIQAQIDGMYKTKEMYVAAVNVASGIQTTAKAFGDLMTEGTATKNALNLLDSIKKPLTQAQILQEEIKKLQTSINEVTAESKDKTLDKKAINARLQIIKDLEARKKDKEKELSEANKKESTKASSILNTEEKEKFNLKSLENEVNLQAEILGATYKTSKEIVSLKAMEYDAIEKLRINNFDLEEEALIEKLALANEIKDLETRQANQDKIKADILQNLIKKEEYLTSLKIKSNDEVQKGIDLEQKRIEKADTDALKSGKFQFDVITQNVDTDSVSQLENDLEKLTDAYSQAMWDMETVSGEAADKLYYDYNENIKKIKNELESIKDIDININIKGFDDFTNGIAGMINGFAELGDIKAKHEKQTARMIKGTTEYDKVSLNTASNQIGAYANMTGAMSGFFTENEQAQKKLMELQRVMLMAQMAIEIQKQMAYGKTALAASLTLPPPASFVSYAATAAMLASLGIMVGGMIGGKDKHTESYDTLSAMADNKGTGTVLGDIEAGSNSIKNSLEILSDFAKPEYNLTSQMAKSLESIDNKIGGVTTMLLRNAGYALGEGYTGGYDTGYSNNFSISQNGASIGTLGGVYAAGATTGGVATAFTAAAQTALPYIAAGMVADKLLFDGAIMGGITSLTNKVLGGVFGKSSTSQSLTDAGLIFGNQLITTAKEDFEGSAYQTIATTVTKKSWFSKSKKTSYTTATQDMDEEIRNQFELIVNGMYESVLGTADMLDGSQKDLIGRLSDFEVKLGKISLKGLTGSEMQEKLSNVFGKTMDEIVTEAYAVQDFMYADFDKKLSDYQDTKTKKGKVLKTAQQQLEEAQASYDKAKSDAHTTWLDTTKTTLDGFQKVGETISETLMRVSTGMQEAEYYIKRLGYQYDETDYEDIINQQGDAGAEALRQSLLRFEEEFYNNATGIDEIVNVLSGTAEELYETITPLYKVRDQLQFLGFDINGITMSMLSGAGGVDALSSAMDDYFENFLTPQEQLTSEIGSMTKEFEKLGLSLPIGKQGFKDLVAGIDTTTASGQDLFGRVILLSDSFAELNDTFNDEIIKSVQTLSGVFGNLGDTIEETINNLLGNTKDAENQDILKTKFWEKRSELDVLFAKNGDLTLAEQSNLEKLIGDINSLSINIQGASEYDNTGITNSLVAQLENIKTEIDLDNTILKTRIVDANGNDIKVSTDGVLTAFANAMASYTGVQLPSFAKGTPYLPDDMIIQAHQREMIIDPQSSDVLRKYGIKVNMPTTPANNLTTNENQGIIEAINKQTEEIKKLNARMEKIELLNKDTRDNTERMAIGA